MLPSQLVQVPFREGLDEKTDKRHTLPTKLIEARNVRFAQKGSVEKRPGMDRLAETVPVAQRLISRGTEVVVVRQEGTIASYSPALEVVSDSGIGPNVSHACSRFPIGSLGETASDFDIAYGVGAYVVTWLSQHTDAVTQVTQDTMCLAVIDAETGAELKNVVVGSGFISPRVCFYPGDSTPIVVDPAFVWAYMEASTGIITAYSMDSNFDLSLGHATITGSDPSFDESDIQSHLEICARTTDWLLITQDQGTRQPKLYLFDYTLSLVFSTLLDDTEDVYKRGWGISTAPGENIWCGWVNQGDPYLARVSCTDPVLEEISPAFPMTVHTGVDEEIDLVAPCRLSGLTALVGISGAATFPVVGARAPWASAPVVNVTGAVEGSATSIARRTFWAQFASEPFVTALGQCLAWFTLLPAWEDSERDPCSYQLVDLGVNYTDLANVQASAVSGLVCARSALPPGRSRPSSYSSVAPLSADKHVALGQIRKSNDGHGALTGMVSDAADPGLFASCDVAGSVYYTPGGFYDGRNQWPLPFCNGPLRAYVTMSGMSDGHLAAGTYAWVVVPSIRDRNGNVFRGTPTLPVMATAAADDTATILVAAVTIFSRQAAVLGVESEMELYRTLVGGDTSGPFFHWSGFDPISGLPRTWSNRADSGGVAITDGVADTDIQNGAQVYTAGGVLENVCPPAFSSLVTYHERLVGVGEDGRTLWFSKAFVDGEGIGWSDEFTVQWGEPESITSLAVMDEKLIAFTRSRIYVNVFTGPGDSGGVSDVGPWQRLQADSGCTQPRSLVSNSSGVFFRSAPGIYLLSRALEVSFIGQPVARLLTLYPTVTSAVDHSAQTCVMFTATDGSYGTRLVYDYRVGQWTYDEVAGAGPTGFGRKIVSQAVVDGELYALADVSLFKETTATYLDNTFEGDGGQWVTACVETGNVALSGLQGYQRVRRLSLLGERYTSADLTVEVANDFSATFYTSKKWEAVTLDALDLSETQIHLSRQKCQAVRVRLTDSPPTGGDVGTGRGYSLNGLLLEVGAKRGSVKVAAPQKG